MKWLALCIIVLSSSLLLALKIDYATQPVSKDEIHIIEAEKTNFDSDIVANGRLVPKREMYITASESGQVVTVPVSSGGSVSKGDTIAVLRNQTLEDQLQDAETMMNAKRLQLDIAALENIERESSHTDRLAAARKERLVSKNLLVAKSRLMGMASSPISVIDYEQAKLDYSLADEVYTSAQQTLNTFRELSKARLKQIEMEIEDLVAVKRRLSRRIDELTLTSPMTGALKSVNIESGQRLSVGDVVAEVTSSHEFYARLEVSVLDAYKISVGQPVEITVDMHRLQGRISRLDSTVTGGGILIDVEVDDVPISVRDNTFVSGRVAIGTLSDVIALPKPRGAKQGAQGSVFVMDSDDRKYASRRQVTFGAASSSKIVVESGIEPGEQVLVFRNGARQADADRVRVR